MQASKEAKVCSSVLQAERNDNAVWDALLDKATDIAALYNINPSISRGAGRQQHRANIEAGYSFLLSEEGSLPSIS